jgi:hypothetical protein
MPLLKELERGVEAMRAINMPLLTELRRGDG